MALGLSLIFDPLMVSLAAAMTTTNAQPSQLQHLLQWVVAVAVIVLGLFVYGWSDLIRTHWVRVWAISGVCVTESLRRRVLWVTPLAIIGVVVVSQFQRPLDAQDAIRQTTKFCLFASGMLITVIAVILASTNLPREIENRIIYTIVTKPTTRLEIVLGKVLGFARVSALILLIMGLFTIGYLQLRARPLLAGLKARLDPKAPDAFPLNSPVRTTAEYYVHSGLLATRDLEWPEAPVQVYARPPQGNEHWMMGGEGEYVLIPFKLSDEDRPKLAFFADNREVDLYLSFDIDQSRAPDPQQLLDAQRMRLERTLQGPIPLDQKQTPDLKPEVQVRFLNAGYAPLVRINMGDAGTVVELKGAKGKPFTGSMPMTPEVLRNAAGLGQFVAQVSGRTPATDYGVFAKSAWLSCTLAEIKYTTKDKPLPQQVGEQGGRFELYAGDEPTPMETVELKQGDILGFQKKDGKDFAVYTTFGKAVPIALDWNRAKTFTWKNVFRVDMAVDASQPAPGVFGAHPGRSGQRLTTLRPGADGPVAVFRFNNTEVQPGPDGKVGLQVTPWVEKTSGREASGRYGEATIEIRNRDPNIQSSGQLPFQTESRTTPILVDAKYLKGGNFDVLLRNISPGQNLGIEGGGIEDGRVGSVAIVAANDWFIKNLAKSLFILWLLSLLVVIIAVFCSTFVSWPIAIVLTLLILLAHWGVEQLGPALDPGMVGRGTLQIFGVRNPSESFLISKAVDALAWMLRHLSDFLPDVSKFPVTEGIDRGVSIPNAAVLGALEVIFCYGFPMLVFSYVILKRKEVAP